ncbi:MAG: hypothetical protein Q9226_009233, partial [Calogaya cf. arnoldii]
LEAAGGTLGTGRTFVAENEQNLEALENAMVWLDEGKLDRRQVIKSLSQFNRRVSNMPDEVKLSSNVKRLCEIEKQQWLEKQLAKGQEELTVQQEDVKMTKDDARDFIKFFTAFQRLNWNLHNGRPPILRRRTSQACSL